MNCSPGSWCPRWAWSPGAANHRTAKTAETTTTIFCLEILPIAVLAPSSAFTENGNGSLAAFHHGGLDHSAGVEPHAKCPPFGRNGVAGHSPMPLQLVKKLAIFTGFFHLLQVRFCERCLRASGWRRFPLYIRKRKPRAEDDMSGKFFFSYGRAGKSDCGSHALPWLFSRG
jgi:hypothetical protein